MKPYDEMTPYQLGETGLAAAIPALIRYTKDSNSNNRRLAASAIRKLAKAGVDCTRTVRSLCKLLNDEKPQVRQYSLKALTAVDSENTCLNRVRRLARTDKMRYNRVAACKLYRQLTDEYPKKTCAKLIAARTHSAKEKGHKTKKANGGDTDKPTRKRKTFTDLKTGITKKSFDYLRVTVNVTQNRGYTVVEADHKNAMVRRLIWYLDKKYGVREAGYNEWLFFRWQYHLIVSYISRTVDNAWRQV